MAKAAHPAGGSPATMPRASTPIRVLGAVLAAWCIAFAVVNVVFEVNGRFDSGPYARYAAALTVMSWLVVGLKILGAGVALSTLRTFDNRGVVAAVGLLVWGAFGVLGIYSLGNLSMIAGILLGIVDDPGALELRNLAYVGFFLFGALGYGVLAASFRGRNRVRRPVIALGLLGAPVFLAVLLVVLPRLLSVGG